MKVILSLLLTNMMMAKASKHSIEKKATHLHIYLTPIKPCVRWHDPQRLEFKQVKNKYLPLHDRDLK